MIHFIESISRCLQANQSVGIATILSHTGSTPRTAGAQMLVMPDGGIMGTIGGGESGIGNHRSGIEIIQLGKSANKII